jgi:hypothetical protein
MRKRGLWISEGQEIGGRKPIYSFRDGQLRYDVLVDPDTLEVNVGGLYWLPERFTVKPKDKRAPVIDVVVVDGRPECEAIRRRPGGPELTGDLLRERGLLPIAKLVNGAAYGLALENVGVTSEGEVVARHVLARGARAEFDAAHRRGVPLGDEHYRTVASVYRTALPSGRPTAEVMKQLNASRSTAGRWVTEARRRGFLGETTPRRAGEVTTPSRAARR